MTMMLLSRAPAAALTGAALPLLLLLLVAHSVTPSAAAAGTDEKSSVCAGVDASLAEIRSVVADLSSLITHTSITPITSSSSSRREEEGWEDDAGLEMDEYSVQLRVRLPRADAKTENAAQGKVQHEHSHNRNQSRTIITSSSPPSSRQQLPMRAAMLLYKLISGSTIDSSGAGRAGTVEELLGSLLAPLHRSLSPLCAEREDHGHGNSNDDEGDDGDEQPQPKFVGLAHDGDGDAGESVIDSNQHEDTHGSMEFRGGMDSSQPVRFPPLMPDPPTVSPRPNGSQRLLAREVRQLSERRMFSPSSRECSLSTLTTAILNRGEQAGDDPLDVLNEVCRELSGNEPFFTNTTDVFLSLVIGDRSVEVIDRLDVLSRYLRKTRYNGLHISVATKKWSEPLKQLLREVNWRTDITILSIDSRLPDGQLQPGALPADALHRFSGLKALTVSKLSFDDVRRQILENLTSLETLELLDTKLPALTPGLFKHASSLERLHMANNYIASIEEGVFDGLTNLHTFVLERTQLESLPAHLLRSLPALQFLRLSNNEFSYLPSTFFVDLPGLEILDLSNNRLTELPNKFPAHKSNLTHVDLRNNSLTALPDAFFARVSEIDSLLLTNNPRLDLDAQQLDVLEHPQILHLTNLPLTGNIESVFVAKADVWSLSTLTIGWEGLREDALAIPTICNVLDDTADLLSITHSSYRTFEGCEGKSINNLVLSNDQLLMNVTVGNHNRLDLSYSSSLTTLTATGRIPTVDVSGTKLPYSALLCRQLGSAAFTARQMLSPDTLEPELLLRQCFEEGSIFDFSENEHPFFGNPGRLTATIPQRIVFRENEKHFIEIFEDTGREPGLFRTSVPTFLFNADEINCQVSFEEVDLLSLNTEPTVRAAIDPVLAFSTTCSCARGYCPDSEGLCELIPTRVPVGSIVLSATLLPVLMVGVQLLYRWVRRKQRERYTLLQENELQERLLSKANEDVAALKQGWRISLDEVHLINKVDEGAFGAVWRGDWEGVAVAIKFLKLASFGMVDFQTLRDIEKEVDFLQRTRHTNLVRFFGTGTDRHGAPFLVLEFVDLGSLKHLLHERGLESTIKKARRLSIDKSTSLSPFHDDDDDEEADSEDEGGYVRVDKGEEAFVVIPSPNASPSATFALRVKSAASLKLCLVRDIVDGMAFLHSLDVMHRDLKSGNVLVNKRLVAKITDFGSMSGKLSRIQQQSAARAATYASAPVAETRLEYSPSAMSNSICLTMTDGVGTPLYMAPEILDPQLRKLSLKADVFSFGVLMWEISECRVPDLLAQEIGDDFSGFVMQTLLQLYRDGKHLHFGDIDDDDKDNIDKDSEKRDDGGSSSSSSSCPMWYQTLSLLCMSFSPSDRPSFEQIRAELKQQQQQKH